MPDLTHTSPVHPIEPEPDVATCAGCGCTDDLPCAGGCYWVHTGLMLDVCSSCAPGAGALESALRSQLADEILQARERNRVENRAAVPSADGSASHRLGLAEAHRIVAPRRGTTTPPPALPLRWGGLVHDPSGDTQREHTLVPCTGPADYPAVLQLTDETRLQLGSDLLESVHYAEACTTAGCGQTDPLPLDGEDRYGWVHVAVHGTDGRGAWWCSPGCAYGAVAAATAALGDIEPASVGDDLDMRYGLGAADEYAQQVAEAAEAALTDQRVDDGEDGAP